MAKDQTTKARGLVPLSNEGHLSFEKVKSLQWLLSCELGFLT